MAPADEGEAKRVEIKLDLDRLKKIADIGVRRTSAFLKLGGRLADMDIPDDMTLDGGIAFNFWPKELPKEAKEKLRQEFRAWLVGLCLRELDQHLGIFLDTAWRTLELSELHRKRVHSSQVVEFDKRFVDDTNTSRKFALLKEKLKIEVAEDCHNSLSLARNALTHALGRIRQRDCNRGDGLEVLWISPEMVIQDGDQEIVLRDKVFDTYQVKSPDGAHVGVRFVKHGKTFKLGDRVEFSSHELAEICFFYKQQADLARDGVSTYLKAKGIFPSAKT